MLAKERTLKIKRVGKSRTAFATKNLEGYITNVEIDRPGYELYAVTEGKYIYKKIEK